MKGQAKEYYEGDGQNEESLSHWLRLADLNVPVSWASQDKDQN